MSQIDISRMDFKQLRAKVQELEDTLALMKRRYEDILYNLDDGNFSGNFIKEKEQMKTEISVNAEGIKTKVSQTDLDDVTEIMYSEFEQTAGKISMCVSKTAAYGSATSGHAIPTAANTTAEEKEKMYFCEANEKYYYFNPISNRWIEVEDDNIYSAFVQTPYGFELSGAVEINGDLITTGTISADRIDAENLACTRLYAKGNDKFYAKLNGGYGDFGIYSPDALDDASPQDSKCLFGIYNTIDGVSLYMRGSLFLRRGALGSISAYGTWDFSNATINWGDNGSATAVFG